MDPERWRQLTDIFHDAVAIDAGAKREAYLKDACQADPSLRAEVDALLAGHRDAGSFGETPVFPTVPAAARLAPGTTLGPYRLEALLGAGGMGEVFRAHDSRLNRDVAIKVLPSELGHDDERRERFLREAEAVASLNHAHICTLHDIGQHQGTDFLVMELLEGETLSARLEKGALTVEDALQYGGQIADALAAAHRAGVVHRDLKPGNIMLTTAGAKLLDFGLAKLRLSLGTGKTRKHREVTAKGAIIGTLQYMAPEQVEGREADVRTDIFAFGAVLYEMLTGEKAFKGESKASLAGSILKDDPLPMTAMQPLTPRTLEHVVRRCLEKSPDDRWQSASDLTGELTWITEERVTAAASGEIVAASARTKGGRLQRVGTHLAWLTAGVVITGLGVWAISNRGTEGARPGYFQVPIAPAEVLSGAGYLEPTVGRGRPTRTALAISRDGSRLVFVGMQNGQQMLFVRERGNDTAVPLDGTEGGESPFISPNGEWVGFWSDGVRGASDSSRPPSGGLRTVRINGGTVAEIVQTDRVTGVSWGDGDIIVYSTFPFDDRLWRVSAGGGPAQPVLALNQNTGERLQFRLPHVLPGGRHVLYTYTEGGNPFALPTAKVAVLSLETGTSTDLIDRAADGRYVPSGHLVFMRAGQLMAIAFDPERLETSGAIVGVLDDVMQAYNVRNSEIDTGAGQYACSSQNGELAYLTGGVMLDYATPLTWIDRSGHPDPLPLAPADYIYPRLSPDGRSVVVARQSGYDTDLVVYDIARNDPSPLGLRLRVPSGPLWARDSQSILYSFINSVAADGSGQPDRLREGGYAAAWGPNRELIFLEGGDGPIMSLWPDGTEKTVLDIPGAAEASPTVSQDGQWLAYVSDRSGAREVYVQPYPSMEGQIKISVGGGQDPHWTRGGREILYVKAVERPWSVMAVDTTELPEPGIPVELFKASFSLASQVPGFDVTLDGERLLVVSDEVVPSQPPPPHISLIVDWFEKLRELAPGR